MNTLQLIQHVKAFLKTEKAFFKNASFVFGGKFYIAILSLLLTPILARIYAPSDYGTFGIYHTIVQNLAIIGTLSLPLAIGAAKRTDLNKLISLTVSAILLFTGLFTIVLYVLNPWLDQLFNTSLFTQYGYFLIIGFALTAVSATLASINNRLTNFKTNSAVQIIEGSSAKVFNLGSGWLGLTNLGLIISDLASKFIGVVSLLIKLPKEVNLSFLNPSEIKAGLRQFKETPLFVMPSQWVGMLNNQFIIIAVAILYSNQELGQLVMAIGLLNIPLHLLSNTFQPVITEKLASLKGDRQRKAFFKKYFFFLLLIASVVFITLMLIPATAYTWVLGDQWKSLGAIINVLALYYIFLHLDQAFENGFLVVEKQKAFLYFSLLELAFQIGILLFAFQLQPSLLTILLIIALIRSLVSSSRVMYLWKNLNPSHHKNSS
ncbi:MAG: oligosaccharide flippase family protein [Flavobacteriaceae bacterium]|nr:oligosaccharide flippase family protein [Flavobacteriaceae bacterium]